MVITKQEQSYICFLNQPPLLSIYISVAYYYLDVIAPVPGEA